MWLGWIQVLERERESNILLTIYIGYLIDLKLLAPKKF